MKTMRVYITQLNNGDFFSVGVHDYLFVGKTTFQGADGYVGCDQANGDFKVFDGAQFVEIPRPKPQRTDFWYKKKFLELIHGCVEHDEVDKKFRYIANELYDNIVMKHYGNMWREGVRGYAIAVDYKYYDGVTIMLINTRTGKSVACKHIDPHKVTTDNVYVIFIDLYKKYMNQ